MSEDRNVDDTKGGEIRVAYCSACDREVRLQVPPDDAPSEEDGGSCAEAYHLKGICLDVGEDCTGAFCPFGDQPYAEGSYAAAVAKRGVAPEGATPSQSLSVIRRP